MELGRGLRKKRKSAKLDSESDSESDDGRKNKRIKHTLEKKIPSPPQMPLSESNARVSYKDSADRPKYSICKQLFPQKTQVNVALQEKREKDVSCENKTSTETSSASDVYDRNSKILEKLEQVKRLKKQKCEKKKTVQYKTKPFSHNQGEKSLRECSGLNEQNESAISSSCQSSQKDIPKKVHKLTLQNKEGFTKASSSKIANDLSSCINTNSTPVKQIITVEDSSSCTDPDSPNTMVSKSSASVRRYDVVQNEGNYRRYLILECPNISLYFFHQQNLLLM